MKARAIVFREHGVPSEVARLESVELPELKAGQVRVRMEFAPINPADLNVLEGTYPIRPDLTVGAVPGGEGVGRVEAGDFALGERVLLPRGVGTWCEACVVPAEELVRAPIEPIQASMLRVNPASALRMLRDFVPLEPGDWILQNAANSGVGRAVIQIARILGWRTVNVVRRPELVQELKGEGADVVLLEDEVAGIAEWTGGAGIRLALNAVGGESALRLAEALAPSGTIVTYGAMARKPLRIPNGLLIFKDLRWRGFWLSEWDRQATKQSRGAMYAELVEWARLGLIHSPVDSVYGLEEIGVALARAQQGQRSGKVLLRL